MRRVLTWMFALCMALTLCVTAFADVMPPVLYSVTVGDESIPRYTMEYKDDEPSALVQDGVYRAHTNITVNNVVKINGKEYGVETTRNHDDEPITNEYGIRINKWKSYYFLLDDVLTPEEIETFTSVRQLSDDDMQLSVVTQPEPQTDTTAQPTEPPTTTTTTAASTTTAETTTAETQTETETESETETVPETQADTTIAEETTAADETADETQGRSPTHTALVCFVAAVILALTTAVTLVLIRRKKYNKPMQTNKEDSQ